MNREDLLCLMDRYMLEEFSRRTIQGLRQQTLFRLMLGPMQSFLEINVNKEIEKDRQVILHAASLVQSDRFPGQQDVQKLLALARDIDASFLQEAAGFPVKISIPYQDIEPVRQQRLQHLLNESHQLLRRWPAHQTLRATLAEMYDAKQFTTLVFDFLHLYSKETRLLSHSVRMPGILAFARDSLTQTVYMAMQVVARQLAEEVSARLYRSRPENIRQPELAE